MIGVDLTDVIDTMARALFADSHAAYGRYPSWGELKPGVKDSWRRSALAALYAGLPELQQLFACMAESRIDHCYNDPAGDAARAAYRDAAQVIRAPILSPGQVKARETLGKLAAELDEIVQRVDVDAATERLRRNIGQRYPHDPCNLDTPHGPHLWGDALVHYCEGR